ncbi:efflux RND transporter permease subunit [Mucilaginibacter gotjawali]|uniref:Cobalt-zinc-cadmium resistance protein CzcA n=2 Tax=Mucilaginibacter gotjawali TaxID=1550579 RepID=A0A110AZQ8_9SPHI|nr:CusA/CzcA family heavy metal efflux RND transporter [Mucilaginibacter gotjawali]MBB3058066.1 cobalt-zinc-cadmium resistance protein CzcA [Mucilaginibacter gotjawali]BAU52041.1 Cobalt-zinc-cadmium resistance protein CzcA [Mucilaginibacter gotjawali]
MNKFIKNILAFALKNRFFIFFVTALMAVAGYISFKTISIDAFPDVTNTSVVIITQWPGRSAEEVEKFVTRPIELALNPAEKKVSIRSSSLFGLSVVTITFDDGIDYPEARLQVNNHIGDADLPDGVSPSIEPPYGPTGEIYRFTLTSNKRSSRELKTLEDWVVAREIRAVPGVADVNSFGGQVKTYQITIDPQKAVQYNVTPLQLYDAVSKSNVNVGGDVIDQGGQAFAVRGIGLLNNIDEIKNVVINNIKGTPIYVKTVAEVTESALPRLGQVGRDKDPDVVEGIVVMRKGGNPSMVIKALKDKIYELNHSILPDDVKLSTFYDREDLVNFATNTVLHNMAEGIILVTVIVFLFMADWRTTLIVSLIIPLALLFAFICLKLKGMSANLLSMGAIDFGIIIDGAVVMVEGIFVVLDHRAKEIGMPAFNKMSKLGLIKRAALVNGKGIFFAKLIIITGLLPIFSFEKVEGKMFSPLAWTLGFALLGAVILTFTFVPALASVLLRKDVKERHNVFVEFITKNAMRFYGFCFKGRRIVFPVTVIALVISLGCFSLLGTEFLPELNEGAIYVRATGPLSISLKESVKLANEMRRIFLSFDEVKQVMSQTGRPNDGTDATGFYNIEFHVDIYPEGQWKLKETKEQLIRRMQEKLKNFPGIDLNFSQPISDNVEEAVSGVKGSIVVKMFGDNYKYIESKEMVIDSVLKTVKGIEDLGVMHNMGQPELQIDLNQQKMAQYGVTASDANAVIEMAIGGKAVTQIYEGEQKFDLRIRYPEDFRNNEESIGDLRVPTLNNNTVPLREISSIQKITGISMIYRDHNQRYGAIKFSIRGRDMGSTVKEARDKVNARLNLPKGYTLEWAGDFENQQRATKRLSEVVPISLLIIFFILFILFGNFRDSLLVLNNVPFAIMGGILALLITGINFNISAGIGFIALFGICVQNGVILISKFKSNIAELRHHTHWTSFAVAIKDGVADRLRPVVMTAMMAAIGLLPAAMSHGIGSEASKPLAIVVIGGLITNTIFNLFVFPIVFFWSYRKRVESGIVSRI